MRSRLFPGEGQIDMGYMWVNGLWVILPPKLSIMIYNQKKSYNKNKKSKL